MDYSYDLNGWGISGITPNWLTFTNSHTLCGRLYYILEEGAGYISNGEKHLFKKDHFYVLPANAGISFFLKSENFYHLYVDFIDINVLNYDHVISFHIDEQPLIKRDIETFITFTKTNNIQYANRSGRASVHYSNKERINLIIASLVMDIKSAFPETSSSDPIVEKVIFYIRRNFYTDIKIGDIAKTVNLSESQLSRIFKKSTELTLYQYLRDYRFDIALGMLESGISISEVAEKVGFLSVSAFSNSFKKKFGFPPTKIN